VRDRHIRKRVLVCWIISGIISGSIMRGVPRRENTCSSAGACVILMLLLLLLLSWRKLKSCAKQQVANLMFARDADHFRRSARSRLERAADVHCRDYL
jgi:hypothetical protein